MGGGWRWVRKFGAGAVRRRSKKWNYEKDYGENQRGENGVGVRAMPGKISRRAEVSAEGVEIGNTAGEDRAENGQLAEARKKAAGECERNQNVDDEVHG